MKKVLLFTLSFLALALCAENLLNAPNFSDRFGGFGSWTTKNDGALTRLKGQGPDGVDAIAIDLAKSDRLQQTGLKLIAGERYLIGGVVRTKGFTAGKKSVPTFYITNRNWEKEAKAPAIPADTDGQWVKVEREVKIPESKDGLYSFILYCAGGAGELALAEAYVIPVSDRAKQESARAPQWDTDNLLLNSDFVSKDLGPWRSVGGAGVDILEGQGIGGVNALKLDFAGCRQFRQTNLELVAGEKYLIGGWVRTSNFVPGKNGAAFIVYNANWAKDVKTAKFPADTKGKWVHLQREVVMPPSKDGNYVFTIYGDGATGNFEVCNPYLVPLSKEAKKKSHSPREFKNLIRNAEFVGDDTHLDFWDSYLSRFPGAVKLLPGAGPNGQNALKIDMTRCVNFSQGGFKLVQGEKYRVGVWMRTRDFVAKSSQVVISNHLWTIGVGTGNFPRDTHGRWVRWERDVTAQESKSGKYNFNIYAGKCSGEIEICYPYLIPLSEKAAAGASAEPLWQENLPLIVPFQPILTKILAATGEFECCVVYPAGGPFTDYVCRVSYAGTDGKFGEPKSFPFDKDGLSKVAMGPLPEGPGKFRLEMVRKSDGKVILTSDWSMNAITPIPPNGKRLNNFVVEIFRGPLENKEYSFTAWEDGWYRIGFTEPQKEATAKLDGAAEPVVSFSEGEISETMRFLKRGKHTVKVENAAPGAELIIAKVPQLPVFAFTLADKNYYDVDPSSNRVPPTGFRMSGDFARKYLWHSFNTYFFNNVWYPRSEIEKWADAELKRRGFDMQACDGLPIAVWSDYKAMIENVKTNEAWKTTDGRILDETLPSAAAPIQVAMIRMAHAMQDSEKRIHVWEDVQYMPYFDWPVIHRPLIGAFSNASKGRGKLLLETYILSTPDTESMEEYFAKFVKQMTVVKQYIKDPQERFMYFIGNYQTAGVWCANRYPQTDMKYFFDRYMQVIATAPDCLGLAGFGCYSIASGDEEMQRWICKLFRHYCIEGRTDLVSDRYGFKLNPGFISGNLEFEDGFNGWDSRPAEKGSLVPHRIAGYAQKYQCRRMNGLPGGDTCALFTRSAKGPNKLSRKITGLTPGKNYNLIFMTADPADIENKNFERDKKIVFDATFDGATVVPEWSYDRRAGGKQFQNNPIEIQTRKIVFRADRPEVTVTFSDWLSDTEPGGPVGGRRLLNFISVTPRFEVE